MAHLVFVCWGNICRSPIAERVARKMVEDQGLDITVESYGLSSEEEGNPIDPRAAAVLERAGYTTDDHAARRLQGSDLADADLVVAVEPSHVERVKDMAPNADVRLLNDFNPAMKPGTPLTDPWFGEDAGFDDTLADVEAAMQPILDTLSQR